MTIVITAAHAGDMLAILALLERSRLPPDGLREHVATTLVARDCFSLHFILNSINIVSIGASA
jgi:hypothetical protein